MSEFRYPAYRMYQTDTGKPLVLFAAPAADIAHWAGVPQRKRLDERETLGFQREEKPERVREIASFFRDPRNVVQNPLLAALQDPEAVHFVPSDEESPFGELVIDASGLESLPLVELLRRLAALLRQRVPSLGEYQVPSSEVDRLIAQVQTYTVEDVLPEEFDDDAEADDLGSESDIQDGDETGDAELGAVLLSEETNIVEFYSEVQARVQALDRISPWSPPEFLGFTREAVLAYLLPVVLVDGQHRLRGAVEAARGEMQDEQHREELYEQIGLGGSPDEVQEHGLSRFSRRLPVSLLMNDSPSEHVFQFVVVNQKATPMPSALLGTIVATSLGADELEPVAQRLRNAGINLEDSRAIAYLTRAPESPFRGLVQTGMTGDQAGQLQWTVFQGLVRIFRQFSGGRLYGYPKNDYAAIWAKKCLSQSALVADAETLPEMMRVWGEPAGPWRDIFVRFFMEVRDFFGDPSDMGAHNAWGNTRSNLFNKISLTILAADYFEFLCGREETLSSADDVTRTVALWLKGVNPQYFARDWRLTREKKDSTKIRNKWASLWFEYRRNPTRMPLPSEYYSKV